MPSDTPAAELAALADLANLLPGFVWSADADGAPDYYSAGYLTYLGRSIDDGPFDWVDAVHADDRAAALHAWHAAAAQATEFSAELRIRRFDGVYRWFAVRSRPQLDAARQVARWFGTVTDIHHRLVADDRTRASQLGREAASREDELRQGRLEMQARAQELELLLDAAPAAIWIAHDPECQTITGSRLASELLRMRPGSNLSKSASDDAPAHFVVRAEGRELSADDLPVQRAARGEEIRDFEEEVVFDDGSSVALFGNALPLRDAAGAIRGAISAFVDVTPLKVAEARIREAQAIAESANRLKDYFLATVSHELRTPLTAIIGYVTMLKADTIPSDRRDNALAIIERNARVQLRLIEDLLDISRVTSGRIRLSLEILSVAELVGHAVDAVRPVAAQKQIALTVQLHDAPVTVRGDRVRLQQVVWNVLNNAVKFTPEGGTVAVAVLQEPSSVAVMIRDTGPGISPEFLPHLFEPFRQDPETAGGAQRGLGLGLAITRHLVELHGGSVDVESEGPGNGATFWIRLPTGE